jgi:hypothetical protein
MGTELNDNSEFLNPGTMSTDTIQELVDNYRNNQLSYINQNLGIDDAHSIWFDIETVKKFIEQIEYQARLIDPSCPDKNLGIRFYYAAYPQTPTDPIPEDYALRHTLVMIPTKKEDDGSGEMLNYDFNPFESDSETDKDTALALTAGINRSALAQNHGDIIPPGTAKVESY